MNLAEANSVIRDDKATPGLWAIAGAAIYMQTPEKDKLSQETLISLLFCLKRKGGAISSGTLALYNWTKRPMSKELSHDPKEWEIYLRDNKFLS